MYMPHNDIAVRWIVGVSFDFVGPTDSAPTSDVPLTPKIGSTATNRTTTPIPPSQFVSPRQNMIDFSIISISDGSGSLTENIGGSRSGFPRLKGFSQNIMIQTLLE